MQYVASPKTLRDAMHQLTAHDPVLGPVIAHAGLPTFRPHRAYYQELGESIIGQQLSVKAAASVRRRFLELFGGSFPTPEAIVDSDIQRLRSAGLSRAKASYIQDLAR